MKNLVDRKENRHQFHILECHTGWLAVDKPCGLSVHNDPGNDLISIVHTEICADARLADRLGTGDSLKVQPVHRLDKETSGVILLAVEHNMLRRLSELFTDNRVKKRYMALVHGRIHPQKINTEYNVWTYPLSKNAAGRTNPAGSGRRVPCRTRFNVLQQSEHYALLDIELDTGRKHQIRRHAKLSGHPVTGDTRYGSKRSIRYLKDKCNYHRLGLHCLSLEFIPPGGKKSICIVSDQTLTEMKQLLDEDGI